MKTVQKTVLIMHSAQQMYALVTDVARYPEFLPWCDHSKVLEETNDGMTAEVGIAFKAVRKSFVTRNRHVPGREVHLQLVRGPFSRLEGLWQFIPLAQDGGEEPGACRVNLRLDYGFSSRLLATVVGPVFDHIASNLVEAFVKRADSLYGAAA